MKKSHRQDELSDRVCANPACNKRIKLRMVEQCDARLCYDCYCKKEANRGHMINTQPRKKRVIAELPVKSF